MPWRQSVPNCVRSKRHEQDAFGNASYHGLDKREKALDPRWHIAMQSGKRRQLDQTRKWTRLLEQLEQLKASLRVKVE